MKVCLACSQRFDGKEWRCPDCGEAPALLDGYLAFAPDLAKGNDCFHADYFPQLAKLEAGNFWFRSRNRLLIWALRRYFPHARNFLEIGCGTGYVLSAIQREAPELVLTGAELFLSGLAFAQKRLRGVSLCQMDGRQVPFDQEFDVIGAFDVLEHIEEDLDVLFQMFQATRAGGGIMVTVPQHPFLWSVVDDISFHKRRYRKKDLMQKMQHAGFTVVHASSFVFLLLPLMLASRMRLRRSATYQDILVDYQIGHDVNVALQRVMSVERVLIEKGFSPPFGGSLLVVAKRMGGES